MSSYDGLVAQLRDSYRSLPPGPVRLAKPTSNLFRQRSGDARRLDVSGFRGVLSVDPLRRTADVLGMTTYEELVDATLPFGLMPLVVPQLKTITIGGAVTGLGIESTSFRAGAPHESVLAMDILTGDGELVTATPDNQHRELFFGFPNSYGTLGYALRLQVELVPVARSVLLNHLRYSKSAEWATAAEAACADETVDFVDGTWFGPDECYLTLGRWSHEPGDTSDYTGRDIYYRSIQRRRLDRLTARDYLWRWDTDWFWCSRAFGAQHPVFRRLWPKRYLRSDVYWKLVAFEKRHAWHARYERWRGRPAREDVVQDVEVPVHRLAEFLDWFSANIPISPVWLCPMRQRDPERRFALWPLDPNTLYVNVGFWSTVPLAADEMDGTHNRLIEQKVAELGGHKSLYSTSHYSAEEFWQHYNGEAYRVLKKAYDGEGRLLDLYDKCVRRR